MFANVDNRKTKRFNSLYWNPGTLGVDAFNSNWSIEVNWLVPPVSLASRAIHVSKWPSAPFWPLIFESDLEYKPCVFDVLEFTETRRILASGQNVNSMFANGTFTGKMLAVKLDASLC
jgi:hypothetical protein